MGRGGRCLTAVAAVVAVAAAAPAAAGAGDARPFTVTTNPYTFDHAPSWSSDGLTVVFHHDVPGQGMQVFTAALDGSRLRCVTCGQPAPNMVPTFRPQGDRILFHSFRGHNIRFGAPGFGGLGATLWVVNPDGSDPVELTPDALGTEGMDNFHAYFSPDGGRIAWTHVDWNFVTPATTGHPGAGTGRWSIYVADYVPFPHPHLSTVRQVRPENGHFYETQWWSPDGRGFLFTESSDTAMDLDLYFVDLSDAKITRLTDNHTWTEQAIFAPDARHILYMSIKDHKGDWAAWSTPSSTAGLQATYDYLLITPLFFGLFLTPATPPACELYEIDLANGDQHRLTNDGDDGWIIPELSWDPNSQRLLWTELKVHDGMRVDQDPSRQLGDEASLLQDPPSAPSAGSFDSGNELFYAVQRTRIGRFAQTSGEAGSPTVRASASPASMAGLPNTASSPSSAFVPGVLTVTCIVGTALAVRRRRRPCIGP